MRGDWNLTAQQTVPTSFQRVPPVIVRLHRPFLPFVDRPAAAFGPHGVFRRRVFGDKCVRKGGCSPLGHQGIPPSEVPFLQDAPQTPLGMLDRDIAVKCSSFFRGQVLARRVWQIAVAQ